MSMERRRETPVYIAGVIQGKRLDLDLEGRCLREHAEHLRQHKQRYYYYSCLFGNYREKHNAACRRSYHENPEASRALARVRGARYRERHRKPSAPRRKNFPECGLDCDHCIHPDCILPLDFEKQLSKQKRDERDPEYRRRWYEAHREELQEYRRAYYQENRDQIREHQKAYRERPEVKARLAQWNRQYQQENRERLAAYKAAWYQVNKDRINAKRRKGPATDQPSDHSHVQPA